MSSIFSIQGHRAHNPSDFSPHNSKTPALAYLYPCPGLSVPPSHPTKIFESMICLHALTHTSITFASAPCQLETRTHHPGSLSQDPSRLVADSCHAGRHICQWPGALPPLPRHPASSHLQASCPGRASAIPSSLRAMKWRCFIFSCIHILPCEYALQRLGYQDSSLCSYHSVQSGRRSLKHSFRPSFRPSCITFSLCDQNVMHRACHAAHFCQSPAEHGHWLLLLLLLVWHAFCPWVA